MTMDGHRTDTEDAAYFGAANRNKESITLDIGTAQGADVVRQLVSRCDILVENFKVGGLKKYGLDYESLQAINPALIYCSITGFGQTGPYASRPGYDFMIQGLGGLMSLTGEPGGEPQKAGVAVADVMTGMYATVAVLAAVVERHRSGLGQHLDIALLDCQVAMMANQNMNYLCTGQAPQRPGAGSRGYSSRAHQYDGTGLSGPTSAGARFASGLADRAGWQAAFGGQPFAFVGYAGAVSQCAPAFG
uniref:CoA carboxyltransferase N-terminal domain-containing protein n=1 Tax=Steinernema glaseri TaxID=37863 RepID=A0A1I8ALW2_9BILA